MEETTKEEVENGATEGVTPAGQEFPQKQNPELTREEVDKWKAKYPDSKFGFFYHVEDLYLYRSYTTADLEALSNKRKEIETSSGNTMTDDEYLALFLDSFICKPEGLGEKHKQKKLSAGIPHLLYDLVNHLSGFAEVEPVIL